MYLPGMRAAFAIALATVLTTSGCGRAGADEAPAASAKTGGQATGTASAGEAVSVRVVPAAETTVQAWVYAQGTARAFQREFLTFSAQGRVAYVNPELKVGSPVREGQVIAYLEPARVGADLATAQAALAGRQADVAAAKAAQAEAQANLELAQTTFDRYQTLVEQNSASKQELDQARAQLEQARAAARRADVQIKATQAQVESARAQVAQARVIQSESRLVSPINGVLARLNIEQGRYFSPQIVQTGTEQGALRTIPALVLDPSRFEIRVDLPAFAYRRIEVGSDVLIGAGRAQAEAAAAGTATARAQDTTAAPPAAVEQADLRGEVHAISPSLDPETRTFEVVIHTTTDQPRLQDGEFVAVWIAAEEQEKAVTVPLEALRYRNAEPFLFVINPDTNMAEERQVTLGPQEGGQRAILSGVKAGELVATEGRARLSDGQRVRIIGRDALTKKAPAKQ